MSQTAAVAPDEAAQYTALIVQNERLARDTYRLRLDCPGIARTIRPGQFLMIRASTGLDPLLGRPFALYDVVRDPAGKPTAIDVVYLVLGRGTGELANKRPGDSLPLWGPLGNGFGPPPETAGPVAFVAGGIGQTPFLALAKWWNGSQTYGTQKPLAGPFPTDLRLYYGARSADLLAGLDDFDQAGLPVLTATDDGSHGHHGFVTDRLRDDLNQGFRPALLVGCGPAPMLAVLTRLAAEFQLECLLSLENHMACGFGACFSCVAPIRQPDGSTDLKRVCVEGPIFPARDVVF